MLRSSDIGIHVSGLSESAVSGGNDRVWLERLEIDLGPERAPRDQAALLLTVAAEIEHALMVQYLYVAYSIRQDQLQIERRAAARGIATRLIQIAREEMGHLITVQNLLQLIGAPPHFGREHSPFESELYPFRFKLEPLSQGALAKYVTAESPMNRPEDFSDEMWARVLEIADEARAANDGQMIRHVGAIFEGLIALFDNPISGIKHDDFVLSSASRQARYEDWGYDPGSLGDTSRRVLVDAFTSEDVAELRLGALAALREISEQGEGTGVGADSHFERFLEIYDDFAVIEAEGPSIVRPLAVNPNVNKSEAAAANGHANLVDTLRAAHAETGRITHARSRNWAYLFNLRYRLLLDFLAHYLRRDDPNYLLEGPAIGDRTARGFLLIWSFDQMRHVKRIAEKLVEMPLSDPADGVFAGPPFQLPYTLMLADAPLQRWRSHVDVVRASRALVARMRASGHARDAADPFLEDLISWDDRVSDVLVAFAAGEPAPQKAQPTDFKKVVLSLEEAVRGFSVDVHENFWTGKDRKEFMQMHMFNRPIIASDSENDCRLTSEGSQLPSVLDRSMPRFRPRMPLARRAYIRNWIDRQAPDSQPPGEIGLQAERAPLTEDPPSSAAPMAGFADHQLNYHRDIQPMFRAIDVSLLKAHEGIDPSDPADLEPHASDLLTKVEAGLFPHDTSWPTEKIALFRRWVQSLS